jgi:hypothetical protein
MYYSTSFALNIIILYKKNGGAKSGSCIWAWCCPIPDSLYQKLPKVNWGAFRKYAPNLPDTCKGQFFLL